jgi:hypothetical protein
MASTMSTAESSVQIGLSPDKAHKKWLEWTGEGGPGLGQSEEITKIPSELGNAEKGKAFFEGSDGQTRVRMQLLYNTEVVKKEGLAPDWVEKRIGLYLQRFKNFAEGRPA